MEVYHEGIRGEIIMKHEDLLAPEVYNIVMEIEKHTTGDKKALLIRHDNDEIEEIT